MCTEFFNILIYNTRSYPTVIISTATCSIPPSTTLAIAPSRRNLPRTLGPLQIDSQPRNPQHIIPYALRRKSVAPARSFEIGNGQLEHLLFGIGGKIKDGDEDGVGWEDEGVGELCCAGLAGCCERCEEDESGSASCSERREHEGQERKTHVSTVSIERVSLGREGNVAKSQRWSDSPPSER